MKEYFEVRIPTGGDEQRSALIVAGLSGLGFGGFVEEEGAVLTYLERDERSPEDFREWLSASGFAEAEINIIGEKNWNEQWEQDYRPVIVGGNIMVRAPFHEPMPGITHDIIIEPRMAFGTAHHETTAMMLGMIPEIDPGGKHVLDMGCGTAVLAILAHKLGAAAIMAVDNDEWAYANSVDNVRINDASNIEVVRGDAGDIAQRHFDIIFANINRNILLQDIPRYAASLRKPGKLLMSGFYSNDLPMIEETAEKYGLKLEHARTVNDWTAALFTIS